MSAKLFTTALLASIAFAEDLCIGLALGTGDQNVAYQGGALKGLLETGHNIQYDAVSGMSYSALNAAMLGSYGKGSELSAATQINSFWQQSGVDQIYTDALFPGGIYDTTVLAEYLIITVPNLPDMRKFVNIGVANVLTGLYENKLAADIDASLQDVLLSSFATPGTFVPYQPNSFEAFFSGDIIYSLDPQSIVNYCLDQGFEQKDIAVDIIMTTVDTLTSVDASKFNEYQSLSRYQTVSAWYEENNMLLRAQMAYPLVNWRNIVRPFEDLPAAPATPWGRSEEEIQAIIDQGQSDAQFILKRQAQERAIVE